MPERVVQAAENAAIDAARRPGPGALTRLLEALVADISNSADAGNPRPGDRFGRFEVLREIGRGGFGIVYEALDVELGRRVALKVLRPGAKGIDSADLARMRQEAQAAAALDHPGIVTLYDAGVADAGPYLVMELLRGEQLDARLARGRLPLPDALSIAMEVAKALGHAHGRGIVHRDLKPANVYLTEDGRVKLLDLGLAHLLGSARRGAAGTPAYMAPEQARGEPVDERADVFAFGVILHEMLAGVRPFDVREGRSTVLDGARPPRLASIPGHLSDLIERCVSADPSRRPHNGEVLVEKFREGTDGPARPAQPQASDMESKPMAAPLAKIARPWLPPVLARTRLFERLDAARARPVVWVEGPPGAGKTTLVASYIEERGLTTVWYQVDEGDGEPATFLNYLALAAGPSMRSKRGLPQITAEHASSIAALARRWFRELYAALPTPFALVLDNYQSVPPESAFHALVREGLEELPTGGNAIVISRNEPGAALARLRARGAVEILGSDALKLTPEESLGVARLRGAADSDEVASLHNRIQGWAAGLVLLLERSGEDAAPFGADEPPQAVFDFFAGEIFDQADANTQHVLLETALLPAVSGSLATRLTGIASAGEVLASLARRGYFTRRSGQPDPTYQYHPLFREFLLGRARASYQPHRLAALRLSAARMLREAGQIDFAMTLYEEASSWEELADCLVAESRALYRAGRIETIVRWIGRVPEELRLKKPWLLYWLGLSKLLLSPLDGHREVERAFDRFWETGDVRGAYFAAVVAGNYSPWAQIWHGATDLQPLDAWIDRLESLRVRYPVGMSETSTARMDAAMLNAMLIGRPRSTDTELEERVYRIAASDGPVETRIIMSSYFAQAAVWKGDFERMQVLVERIGPLVRRGGIPTSFSTLSWYAYEGIYHAMSGAPMAAMRSSRLWLKVAKETAFHGWDPHLLVSVLSSIAGDNPGQARTALGRALEAVSGSARRVPALDLAAGLLALRVGRYDEALERAGALAAFGEKAGIPWLVMFGHLLAGSALLASGREGALAELAVARQVGHENGSVLADYVSGMVEAAARLRAADSSGTAAALTGPMALGRQRRFAPYLWLARREIAGLCHVARQHGIEPDHVRWLLEKR